MCDSVVYEVPFTLMYYPKKYKIQRLCDEAADNNF